MKRIFSACILFCICTQVWAAANTKIAATSYNRRVYLNAAAGDMFLRVSGENFLGTGAGWPADHYSVTNVSNQPFVLVGAGYTWDRDSFSIPSYSLGFRLLYMSTGKIAGYIDQYSLPGFRNYFYTYDIALLNLVGVYKLNLINWHNVMPFLTVGAGLSNYMTSNYGEIATPNVTPRVSPGFGSDSSFNFTYLFGAGFDVPLPNDFTLNLEFDYSDFGYISTGKGQNYTSLTGNYDNEWLKNKLAATSVFIGLTYYPA